MSVFIIEILVSIFVLIGATFALLGSFGLLKLPDFYLRLHGPAKASTLGIGSILIASTLFFSSTEGLSGRELLLLVFLFITAPISAHMLAKAALHLKISPIERTREQAQTDCDNPADQ